MATNKITFETLSLITNETLRSQREEIKELDFEASFSRFKTFQILEIDFSINLIKRF